MQMSFHKEDWSYSDSEHVDCKPLATLTPEQKPPEEKNASASDLEQIGVWMSQIRCLILKINSLILNFILLFFLFQFKVENAL
jgi:hypothetical protein